MAISGYLAQKTLKDRIVLSGIGVHSGKPVSLALCPADADSGIVFLRTDLAVGNAIPALSSSLGATELCTVIGDIRGAHVATVEHLLSALRGAGVDNVLVEIDAAELPVMDGSAARFVDAIEAVGLKSQAAPRRVLKILKPVRVDAGSAFAEFRPHDGCRFEVEIAFDCPVIGNQAIGLEITPESYRREIAPARTFGHMRDVERLWAAGYALGSSLENSVVVGDGEVVNPEGLRFADEFARHKLLDAIGDLALAGAPIQGLYRSFKGGHRMNAMAVSALLAQSDAWTLTTAPRNRTGKSAPRQPVLGISPGLQSKVA